VAGEVTGSGRDDAAGARVTLVGDHR
jgi:hypothetical protein